MENNYNSGYENVNENYGPGSPNYYQNLYNMFGGYNPVLDKRMKNLTRLSMLAGCGVVGFIILQHIVALIVRVTGFYSVYINNTLLQYAFDAVASTVYIMIPFSAVYAMYRPKEKTLGAVYEAPKSPQMFVLAVFAGLMVCFVGDYLTSYISQAASVVGMEFSQADTPMPETLSECFLYFVAFAVVPALVEEFAFRGVVMQPLRKYGDWFAIIMSSAFFALLHGNMVQIPFAFVAGMALGFFRIKTGSIWTSVVIHFFNNAISVVASIYYNNHPDASELPYYVIFGAIFVIGLFALILIVKSGGYRLRKDRSGLDLKIRTAGYLATPTTIFLLGYAFFTSMAYTRITRPAGFLICIAVAAAVGFLLLRGIGLIRNDNRISYGGQYKLSRVLAVLYMIFAVGTVGVFMGGAAGY